MHYAYSRFILGNYELPDYQTTTAANLFIERVNCYNRLTGSLPIRLTDPQCNYTLELENACFLQIDFQQFFTVCPEDFLQVGSNQRICGSANTGTTQLVTVNSNLVSISYVRLNPSDLGLY